MAGNGTSVELARMVVGAGAELRKVTDLTYEDLGYLIAYQAPTATYYGFLTKVSFSTTADRRIDLAHLGFEKDGFDAQALIDLRKDPIMVVISTTQRAERKKEK